MKSKKWSTADKDTQLIFEGWNKFLNEEKKENLTEWEGMSIQVILGECQADNTSNESN